MVSWMHQFHFHRRLRDPSPGLLRTAGAWPASGPVHGCTVVHVRGAHLGGGWRDTCRLAGPNVSTSDAQPGDGTTGQPVCKENSCASFSFGDIALAVGGNFEAYLQVTMSMLEQAGMTAMDVSNPDLVDYLGQLREGIFEAYTGVLQGLRADDKEDLTMWTVQLRLRIEVWKKKRAEQPAGAGAGS